MTNLQDKTITCRDCGREFLFTSGEQEFFTQKGYTNDPTRCPECRAARRSSRGDNPGLSLQPDRQLYPAVCAQCGKSTQVPFQPRSDRPVFCSDCYAAHRPSKPSFGPRSENGSGRRFGGGYDRDTEDYSERRSGGGRNRRRW